MGERRVDECKPLPATSAYANTRASTTVPSAVTFAGSKPATVVAADWLDIMTSASAPPAPTATL